MPAISLPPQELRELLELTRALLGLPIDRWDNFWRLLHLSAATLTTLGYGDVTPVTGRARLLCGLEAIIGVLYAGSFLNWLFSSQEDARKTT